MKIFAFSKIGLIRIIATSLMLSFFIVTAALNWVLQGYTASHFAAMLLYCAALVVFCTFAKMKNHPPLLCGARGWLIASVIVFFLGIVFSLTDIQLSGFFGKLIGYTFIIVSPYFGLFYIIDIDWIYADTVLGIVGIIISALIWFIPVWIEKAVEKRRLVKKYR